jgi:hypothetical protein
MISQQSLPATGGRNKTDGAGRVVAASSEELAALMIDNLGVIRDCSMNCETLFKYRQHEMISQHVTKLLPQLTEVELIQNGQPNARLCFLSRTGHNFQALTKSGECFVCKLFFNLLDGPGYGQILIIVRPA